LFLFGGHRFNHQHMARLLAGTVPRLCLVLDDGAPHPAVGPGGFPGNVTSMSIGSSWTRDDLLLLARDADLKSGRGTWTAVALDDFCAQAAAALAALGGRRSFPPQAAETVLHKDRLRATWNSMCARGELPGCAPTPFACLAPVAERGEGGYRLVAGEDPAALVPPFVVKPTSLDASEGVVRAPDHAALDAAVQLSRGRIEGLMSVAHGIGYDLPCRILIEQAIAPDSDLGGHGEFSAQMLSVAGAHRLVGVTDKLMEVGGTVERGHVLPSAFPERLLDPLERALARVLTALDATRVVSTWDLVVSTGGAISLVEGSLRPSGNHVMELYELTRAVNPLRELVEDVRPRDPRARAAAVLFPVAARPMHRVQRIDRVEVDRAETCVDDLLFTVRDWSGTRAGTGNHVRVLAWGGSPAEALRSARAACDGLLLRGVDADGREVTSGVRLSACRAGASPSALVEGDR
jgi:hypothetical protein